MKKFSCYFFNKKKKHSQVCPKTAQWIPSDSDSSITIICLKLDCLTFIKKTNGFPFEINNQINDPVLYEYTINCENRVKNTKSITAMYRLSLEIMNNYYWLRQNSTTKLIYNQINSEMRNATNYNQIKQIQEYYGRLLSELSIEDRIKGAKNEFVTHAANTNNQENEPTISQ